MQQIKNIRNGLITRTVLLSLLEIRASDASSIAKETSLSYGVVAHHLKLLEKENTVFRKGRRPYVWELTGLGQKRLVA
jgi:predicted transcriptional regulator